MVTPWKPAGSTDDTNSFASFVLTRKPLESRRETADTVRRRCSGYAVEKADTKDRGHVAPEGGQ